MAEGGNLEQEKAARGARLEKEENEKGDGAAAGQIRRYVCEP